MFGNVPIADGHIIYYDQLILIQKNTSGLKMNIPSSPTASFYSALQNTFDHFNAELFGGGEVINQRNIPQRR
jgi:hypothetical protein